MSRGEDVAIIVIIVAVIVVAVTVIVVTAAVDMSWLLAVFCC